MANVRQIMNMKNDQTELAIALQRITELKAERDEAVNDLDEVEQRRIEDCKELRQQLADLKRQLAEAQKDNEDRRDILLRQLAEVQKERDTAIAQRDEARAEASRAWGCDQSHVVAIAMMNGNQNQLRADLSDALAQVEQLTRERDAAWQQAQIAGLNDIATLTRQRNELAAQNEARRKALDWVHRHCSQLFATHPQLIPPELWSAISDARSQPASAWSDKTERLTAERNELAAQNEVLRKALELWSPCRDIGDEVAQALSQPASGALHSVIADEQIKELQKDKERLDWLEQNAVIIGLSLEAYVEIAATRRAIDVERFKQTRIGQLGTAITESGTEETKGRPAI